VRVCDLSLVQLMCCWPPCGCVKQVFRLHRVHVVVCSPAVFREPVIFLGADVTHPPTGDRFKPTMSSVSTAVTLAAAMVNYLTPRLRSKFGERAFSYAGPAAWNRLPEAIRQAELRHKYVLINFRDISVRRISHLLLNLLGLLVYLCVDFRPL